MFALVSRGGELRARKIDHISAQTLKDELRKLVVKSATIMIDQLPAYNRLANQFVGHEVVDQSVGQYVNGDTYTNIIEGWFPLLKHGSTGTFHHVSDDYLDRDINEFVFSYNNCNFTDGERATKAVKAMKGKRLYYKQPNQ